MKLVVIEPLGVEKSKFLSMAEEILGDRVELVLYDTRVTDTETLIERGKDADIIMVANLPMNEEVILGCHNLKLLAVAFTGLDHIAMEACRAKGITVCNCAGYSNAAVSDLVFGMLITSLPGLSHQPSSLRCLGQRRAAQRLSFRHARACGHRDSSATFIMGIPEYSSMRCLVLT